MKLISEFWKEEDAVGVVEVILILVVLIGLVLIFKKQLVSLVNSLMEKVTNQSTPYKRENVQYGTPKKNLEAGTDLYVICISVSRYILYPIHGI